MNNEKKTKTQWKRHTHAHIRKPNYANRITESLTPVIITKKKNDFFLATKWLIVSPSKEMKIK